MLTNNLRNLNIPNTISEGTDIAGILNDIKYNFEQLKLADLWRGPKGDSLVPIIVDFNELFILQGGTQTNYGTTHTYDLKSQSTNPAPFNNYRKLKQLYLNIIKAVKQSPDIAGSDFGNIEGLSLFWVEQWMIEADMGRWAAAYNLYKKHSTIFLPGSIVLMVDSTDYSKVYYTNHYIFIDPRFRNPNISQKDLSSKIGPNHKDCSCVVSGIGTDDFKVFNGFPTLVYNKTLKSFTWKMNGQVTSIPAAGQRGEKGETGTILVVTRIEGPINNTYNQFRVASIAGHNLYTDTTYRTKVDNYEELVKLYTGVPCVILPGDSFVPVSQKGNNLWLGNVAFDDEYTGELIVYCEDGNNLDIGSNPKNLLSTMMDLSIYKNVDTNDGSIPARGFLLPFNGRNEEDKRTWVVYSEYDKNKDYSILNIATEDTIENMKRATESSPYEPNNTNVDKSEVRIDSHTVLNGLTVHPSLNLLYTGVIPSKIIGYAGKNSGNQNIAPGATFKKANVVIDDAYLYVTKKGIRNGDNGFWDAGTGNLFTEAIYTNKVRSNNGFHYGSETEPVNTQKGVLLGDGKITDAEIPIVYDQGEFFGGARYIEFKRKYKWFDRGTGKVKFAEEGDPSIPTDGSAKLVLLGENLQKEVFRSGKDNFNEILSKIGEDGTVETEYGISYTITPELIILNVNLHYNLGKKTINWMGVDWENTRGRASSVDSINVSRDVWVKYITLNESIETKLNNLLKKHNIPTPEDEYFSKSIVQAQIMESPWYSGRWNTFGDVGRRLNICLNRSGFRFPNYGSWTISKHKQVGFGIIGSFIQDEWGETITFVYKNPNFGKAIESNDNLYQILKTDFIYDYLGSKKPGRLIGNTINELTATDISNIMGNTENDYINHTEKGSGSRYKFKYFKDGRIYLTDTNEQYLYILSKTKKELNASDYNNIFTVNSGIENKIDPSDGPNETYKYKYKCIKVSGNTYMYPQLMEEYKESNNPGIQQPKQEKLFDYDVSIDYPYILVTINDFIYFENLDDFGAPKSGTSWTIKKLENFKVKNEIKTGIFQKIIEQFNKDTTGKLKKSPIKMSFPEGEIFFNPYNENTKSFTGKIYYHAPILKMDDTWSDNYKPFFAKAVWTEEGGIVFTDFSYGIVGF